MSKILLMSFEEKTDFFEEVVTILVDNKDLILYNDDHNTFEHVIECLVKYCSHTSIQGEQCAWIVHHNGRCGVKKDVLDKLKPMCEALLDAGLSASIE